MIPAFRRYSSNALEDAGTKKSTDSRIFGKRQSVFGDHACDLPCMVCDLFRTGFDFKPVGEKTVLEENVSKDTCINCFGCRGTGFGESDSRADWKVECSKLDFCGSIHHHDFVCHSVSLE